MFVFKWNLQAMTKTGLIGTHQNLFTKSRNWLDLLILTEMFRLVLNRKNVDTQRRRDNLELNGFRFGRVESYITPT